MIEMAETIQVHFTLEGEGLRAHYHGIVMDEKPTWIPKWTTIKCVSWF